MSALFLKILNMSVCASWIAAAVLVLRFCLKKSAEMGKCAALGLCCRAADLPGFH